MRQRRFAAGSVAVWDGGRGGRRATAPASRSAIEGKRSGSLIPLFPPSSHHSPLYIRGE
ncbi:MAG: hypothetical protein OXU61_10425 [Gammaproteobacteria bacterium]|nr:hypothetical protein [Gammaproteobacteria bacterium]